MGGKLKSPTAFWVDVEVIDPEGEATIVAMQFQHRRQSDFEKLEVGRDGEGIAALVVDWNAEDMGGPFSAETLRDEMDRIPWLAISMFRSYASALRGFVRKN